MPVRKNQKGKKAAKPSAPNAAKAVKPKALKPAEESAGGHSEMGEEMVSPVRGK
jgi:hypothetical protein